jgi:hypothetical protein
MELHGIWSSTAMGREFELLMKDYEKQYSKEVEIRLGEQFRKANEVTKEQLIGLINWKMNGNKVQLIRGKRSIERLPSDGEIRRLTKVAFLEHDELKRLNYLTQIDGVGSAIASCIMAFYDPDNYGIVDLHAWRAVFPKRPFRYTVKEYLEFLKEVRVRAKKNNMTARKIELQLFLQDKIYHKRKQNSN